MLSSTFLHFFYTIDFIGFLVYGMFMNRNPETTENLPMQVVQDDELIDIVSAAMSRISPSRKKSSKKNEKQKRSPTWAESQRDPKAMEKLKQNPVENAQVREAFEYYLSLGEERNLGKVAEYIGVVPRTVGVWSSKYEWVNRALDYDRENADTITIESFGEQREKRKFGLRLIDKILKDSVTFDESGNIATCKIAAKTPSDVRTLISLRDEILNPLRKNTNAPGQSIHANNAVFILKK